MVKVADLEVVQKEISTVDILECNLNEENRIKWVTDLAAISRGKTESKNPKKRYEALLKEAAPFKTISGYSDQGSPSRPLEFLPVVAKIDMHDDAVAFIKDEDNKTYHSILLHDFANNILRFSYMKKISGTRYKLYTNMRALINAGVPYDEIPYNSQDEISDGKFFAVRIKSPMFVWAQFKTHCMLSSESASGRIIDEDEYWLPKDLPKKIKDGSMKSDKINVFTEERLMEHVKKTFKDVLEKIEDKEKESETALKMFQEMYMDLINDPDAYNIPISVLHDPGYAAHMFLHFYSESKVQSFFKELGYPKEIYSRAMYYFKMKEYVATGWGIDPKTWEHLFVERSTKPDIWKNWTQKETKELVQMIKEKYEVLYGNS